MLTTSRSVWHWEVLRGRWGGVPWGAVKEAVSAARLTFVSKTLLIAVAYYASGLVGALLVLPPGYAAPIWPPAGIALSAALLLGHRAWPGILLGAFLVNTWIPFAPLAEVATQQSIVVAVAVTLGAALQAFAGAFLVEQFIGFPTPLTKSRDVLGFLFLAGPVSCVISPTVRVTSLFLGGVIHSTQYPFNWWTWWVGDTVGVIVLTPLILIWMGEPRDVWRRRRLSVTAPLGVVLVMITLLFLYATKWEQAAVTSQFERRAQELAEAIKKNLSTHVEVLYSIQSFYMVSPEINRKSFAEFVGRFLDRHPSILALSWNPHVRRGQRLSYENLGRQEGFAHFQITERNGTGKLIRARSRGSYVPVYYMEPLAGNERALGYDVASDPVRLEALIQARDSGRPMATGWINLSQGTKEQPAFLVFLPVYRESSPNKSTAQRRRNLLGYATGVFRISDIIKVALQPFTHEGVELTLADANTPLRDRSAYFYSAKQQTVKPFTMAPGSSPFTWSTTLEVAGRSWVLHFSPTPAYLASKRSLQSWASGAFGLLISALLGAYLLVATGHTYEVEKFAEKLQAQTLELTKASKVKEEFLGVMSHELRTPLTVMTGYLGMIQDGTLGDVNPKQRETLDRIFAQTDDQLSMINGILQVTQIESAKLTADCHPLNLWELLETIKENYACHRNKPIVLRWDYPADLPTVVTDRAKLKQILQNLLNNAFKFTEQGEVLFAAQYLPEIKAVEFKVSDTGIGISKEALPHIFEKFWQADSSDPRVYGGVGLGLYLVKQFTQLLEGEVSVESEPGKGSTFSVRIPASTELDQPLA